MRPLVRTGIDTGYDASEPGDANSLLVEPIHQGPEVAGALAGLSDECNAFTARDGTNLHLLADLLGQALSRAADSGLQESVSLEPAATLELIERIIPALQRMLESDKDARHYTHGFLHREPGHELPGTGIPAKPFQDSREPGPPTASAATMGGTRTGHDPLPPAPGGDSTSASSPRKLSVPRIRLRTGWKNMLAKFQPLGRSLARSGSAPSLG
jgi:hypothetical protein